ncbi:MAG: hypothetical protein H0V29_03890 [Thermoleophilaceae bacterium]|nr:hypothetical protein [Thermoleophilaceae bacterium]
MTVAELITLLGELPQHWYIDGNKSGSLSLYEPGGYRYGWLFTDGRPARFVTHHGSRAWAEDES